MVQPFNLAASAQMYHISITFILIL